MTKPFASSADLTTKTETLEVLADGVYALTAQGDPNVDAIEVFPVSTSGTDLDL